MPKWSRTRTSFLTRIRSRDYVLEQGEDPENAYIYRYVQFQRRPKKTKALAIHAGVIEEVIELPDQKHKE
jgi:hypothetical protein